MNINFIPLSNSHFPLLLKWLEMPHVKLWWDEEINWTPELIRKKYESYVKGYKKLELQGRVIQKPIHAFIITADNTPIGYIQYYNKHDFLPEQGYSASELPKSCAALDFYIGETEYIGKNIGFKILTLFIKQYILQKFDYVFVNPDSANTKAIHVYKQAGFNVIKKVNEGLITWMIKDLVHSIFTFKLVDFNEKNLDSLIADSMGNPTTEKINQVLESYKNNNQYLIGCFIEQNLIGVIGVEILPSYATIRHISVLQNFRSQGIGQQLILHITKHFLLKTIIAETDEMAVDFYRLLGFNCEIFEGKYGKRYKCIINNIYEHLF